jgi:transposase
MCILRTRLRPRAGVIAPRAPHILHLHKALTLLTIPLSEGLTESTGVTGQPLLRALVQGERDPLKLAP